MPTSMQTTESPSQIPPRRQPQEVRRPESLTVAHVEEALAEAPQRHIGPRPHHAEKFVSRATGHLPRPSGDADGKSPFLWKDAAEFGKAQEFRRSSGHLEQQRSEVIRFRIMVGTGSIVAIGCILLAYFK